MDVSRKCASSPKQARRDDETPKASNRDAIAVVAWKVITDRDSLANGIVCNEAFAKPGGESQAWSVRRAPSQASSVHIFTCQRRKNTCSAKTRPTMYRNQDGTKRSRGGVTVAKIPRSIEEEFRFEGTVACGGVDGSVTPCAFELTFWPVACNQTRFSLHLAQFNCAEASPGRGRTSALAALPRSSLSDILRNSFSSIPSLMDGNVKGLSKKPFQTMLHLCSRVAKVGHKFQRN